MLLAARRHSTVWLFLLLVLQCAAWIGGSMYGPDFPYDFVDSYKYGISFQVTVTGEIGQFDP